MSDTLDLSLKVDGVEIRYRCHLNGSPPRARVIILPGFTEFIEKYAATAANFADMEIDSLILDWPGQGLSSRLSPRYPMVIHADGFDLHLKALTAVAQEAGFLDRRLPLFLFGHSMGGHLALRYAKMMNEILSGVILSAPMIMPPVQPPWLIEIFAQVMCMLPGIAKSPVMFRQSKARDEIFHPQNVLTRDPEGYGLQVNWWNRNPALKTTGPSYGWVRSAYQSCISTTADPAWMATVDLPVSAHIPLDEVVVSLKHSLNCLPQVPGIEIHKYTDARHELLLELPEVRQLFWGRVENFVERNI